MSLGKFALLDLDVQQKPSCFIGRVVALTWLLAGSQRRDSPKARRKAVGVR